MKHDWQARATLERRMSQPVFRALSRALGAAVLEGSLLHLVDAVERRHASDDDILLAVQCQGVAGHLRPLLSEAPAAWTSAMLDALHIEAERIADRSGRLRDDLAVIADAARAEELPWSPLKGTWLRVGVDRHPERRPSADIDILVEPSHQARWDALLRRLGYVAIHLDRHATYLRPGSAPVATDGDHPDHPRPVEVHTHITEVVFGVRRDVTAPYRDGLVPSRVQGMTLQAPSAQALALHLVLHGAAAMVSRGLRLAQSLDLRHLGGDDRTRALLTSTLPLEAWTVVALGERDLPGLVPAPWQAWLADAAPSAARRRAILSRPGILEGDPSRWRTAVGEWRLAGTRHVVRRAREAIAGRLALDPDATTAAVVGTYVRGTLDRFTGRRPRAASGE